MLCITLKLYIQWDRHPVKSGTAWETGNKPLSRAGKMAFWGLDWESWQYLSLQMPLHGKNFTQGTHPEELFPQVHKLYHRGSLHTRETRSKNCLPPAGKMRGGRPPRWHPARGAGLPPRAACSQSPADGLYWVPGIWKSLKYVPAAARYAALRKTKWWVEVR